MRKPSNASAKKRFISHIVPIIIILSTISATMMSWVMYQNINGRAKLVNEFEIKREQAYKLTDTFEAGSNYLSYESKLFCESKDMTYFKNYIKELKVTRRRDYALQALDRMGLTTREMSRIQDAKITSDDLTNRELWAMELVALSEGISPSQFPKGTNTSILTDTEKQMSPSEQYDKGYKYIMSSEYFTLKSSIDTKVRNFSADLMQHYGNSTIEMTKLGTSNGLTSFVIILSLVIVMSAMTGVYVYLQREDSKQLSQAMLDAQKANKAKSEFLSSMSHDIRTPMNAVVGMTSMASQNIDLKDYQKAKANLEIVKASSRQLLSLINDVLDLSKIESGKMMLADEPFTLPVVIKDVSMIISSLCVAKSQHYRIKVDDLKHEFLIGDQIRLRQVLLNILNNANKYTPDGGSVSFYVRELDETEAGKYLFEFKIADTGTGISKDKIQEIFKPFTRETSTMVNHIEGTGLGLTIVKNIVEAMDGVVEAESEKDKGSIFTVKLPIMAQSKNEALKRYAILNNAKLLIIGNAEDDMMKIESCLKQVKASNDHTTNISDAIKLLKENSYMAILIKGDENTVKHIRLIREIDKKTAIIVFDDGIEGTTSQNEMITAGASSIMEGPLFCSTFYDDLIDVTSRNTANGNKDRFLEGKRIMVVDDVEINRVIVQAMIKSAGGTFESATSGRQALDMFRGSVPGYYDAILMDVMMPIMGGYEATRSIRSIKRSDSKNIPIIAMTANAFVEDVQKSKEAGMNAHINKPVEPDNFKAVLSSLLNDDQA